MKLIKKFSIRKWMPKRKFKVGEIVETMRDGSQMTIVGFAGMETYDSIDYNEKKGFWDTKVVIPFYKVRFNGGFEIVYSEGEIAKRGTFAK